MIFSFSYLYAEEKLSFWGKVCEIEILLDLHCLLDLKILFLAVALHVYMYVCVNVSVITQKETIV